MKVKDLEDLYEDGPERVGFIIDDCIIEVDNICADPEQGFMIKTEDILQYADIATATWHTHPNVNSNISDEDYVTVKNWPKLVHYIIGNDGVSCYKYDQDLKAVVKVDNGES